MRLHVIEEAHVVSTHGTVAINVHAREPELNRGRVALVFFREHEVYKVGVPHFVARRLAAAVREWADGHVEYAIHDRTAETVAAVLQQVFA